VTLSLDVGAVVDIRCSHQLAACPCPCRCQLLAGHDGPHAVMYCTAGRRAIRRWSDGIGIADETERFETLPWVRGLPVPAWAE
jgi:hypothetical protein